MWSILIPYIVLTLSILARPIASPGKLVNHRSPGWDDAHHSEQYRRWERLNLNNLQKRDAQEWETVEGLFRRTGKRSEEREFELSIRLLPRDQDTIRTTLKNIGDPTHPEFRKFLTHEQTMQLLSYVLLLPSSDLPHADPPKDRIRKPWK